MKSNAESIIYAQPATQEGRSWVQAEMLRHITPREQCAHFFANQLGLPGDSPLRQDMVSPRTYEDVIPEMQRQMVAHLKDFSNSADVICNAILEGKKIGISSDYDADGNCSAALFIRTLRTCGVPPEKIVLHIPNRGHEGYGVNDDAVGRFAKQGVDLMVTLDNGTRAEGPVKRALESGMQVVVVDHHGDGGKVLPPEAHVVNPNIIANRDAVEAFPLRECKNLAAVGVSYMLAAEIMKRLNERTHPEPPLSPRPLLGLVALATVSDVVPMDNVLNRVLVREGLDAIHRGEDKNILRFCKRAGIENIRDVNADTIAFRLGPLINAPGRLGDSAAWVFLSAGQDGPALQEVPDGTQLEKKVEDLRHYAENHHIETFKNISAKNNPSSDERFPDNPYLDRLIRLSVEANDLRKAIEHRMRPQIRKAAQSHPDDDVIVCASEEWHEGVIGIAAGRIKEELGKPAVIGNITYDEHSKRWRAKFSARSIRVPGHPVDIGAAFGTLGPLYDGDKDSLLAAAGGHPMAGGATIYAASKEELEEKINLFRTRLNELLSDPVKEALLHKRDYVFGTLNLARPTLVTGGQATLEGRLHDTLASISSLGPFGEAFRPPKVAITHAGISNMVEMKNGHIRCNIAPATSSGLLIQARASHASGTPLGTQLRHLHGAFGEAALMGHMSLNPDGVLHYEIEQAFPQKEVEKNPAFHQPGIFAFQASSMQTQEKIRT